MGCASAKTVGLQDCQGYVKAGAFESITFIDVHTTWNPRTGKFEHSQQAQDLVSGHNCVGEQMGSRCT